MYHFITEWQLTIYDPSPQGEGHKLWADTKWLCDSYHQMNKLLVFILDFLSKLLKLWWPHQMETFSVLLAICTGNSLVPSEFPTQRPVTRSCDVFFDLRLNKRSSKQSWGWWFEMLSHPLWRHCNDQGQNQYQAWVLLCKSFCWACDQGRMKISSCPVVTMVKCEQFQQTPAMSLTAVRFGLCKQVSIMFFLCNIEDIFQRKKYFMHACNWIMCTVSHGPESHVYVLLTSYELLQSHEVDEMILKIMEFIFQCRSNLIRAYWESH